MGEENLDKIEQEVISPTYDELNLISSVDDLIKLMPNFFKNFEE
jgi:hypothetical protein